MPPGWRPWCAAAPSEPRSANGKRAWSRVICETTRRESACNFECEGHRLLDKYEHRRSKLDGQAAFLYKFGAKVMASGLDLLSQKHVYIKNNLELPKVRFNLIECYHPMHKKSRPKSESDYCIRPNVTWVHSESPNLDLQT